MGRSDYSYCGGNFYCVGKYFGGRFEWRLDPSCLSGNNFALIEFGSFIN